MASSSLIGILRVLLTANTAEFDASMKAASTRMGAVGTQATALGTTLTTGLAQPIAAVATGSVQAAGTIDTAFSGVGKSLPKAFKEFTTGAEKVTRLTSTVDGLRTSLNGLNLAGVAATFVQFAVAAEGAVVAMRGWLTLAPLASGEAGVLAMAMGALTTTLQLAAAGFVGWQIGRWIDEATGASDAVGQLTANIGEYLGLLAQGAGAEYAAAATAAKSAEARRASGAAAADAAAQLAALTREADALFGRDAIARAQTMATALGDLTNIARLTTDKQKELQKAVGDALAAYQALGQRAPAQIVAIGRALDALIPQQVKAPAVTEQAIVDQTKAVRAYYNFLGEREIENVQREQEAAERQKAIWRDYYNFVGERRMEDDARAEASRRQQEFAATARFGTPLVDGFHPPVAEVRAAGVSLGGLMLGGMGDVFSKQLGSTLMAAVTGGGKILESVGSLIGTSATSGLAKMLKLAGPWGDLLAGAGAVLGPLLDKLFGGVSQEVLQARQSLTGFQAELRKSLTPAQQLEAQGQDWKKDVIAVRDAYLATGRSAEAALRIVEQLWDTDHPERMQAAIEEINAVLREQGAIAADNEHAAADAARAREDELADLRGQLTDLQQEATVDWTRMQDAAKKYGVDLNSLGDQFQGERIHASAQAILDDFTLLTKKGASVGGVLFGMRDEITALVKDAIAFGTALPENFRPLVEELQRSGNLVDENGEQLTDLSRLRFGDPIVANLDRVATALETVTRRIEELVGTIAGPLVDAFTKIPTHIDLEFDRHFNDPPVNVPMMAEGGIVTAPTLAMIGEGPSPEAVVPLHRLGDFDRGGDIVVMPFLPITDPYAAAEEAAIQFRRRVGGDQHGMRATIERVIEDYLRTYAPARA